jgi:hypothetical protein
MPMHMPLILREEKGVSGLPRRCCGNREPAGLDVAPGDGRNAPEKPTRSRARRARAGP